jgi:putative oxidoreductase
MIRNLDAQLDRFSAPVLGLFRIIVGFLFTFHGTTKLFGWPKSESGGAVPVGTWPYWWAGVIELVVGLLLIAGLFTRLAALLGSGTMAFAYFTVHQPKALLPIDNGGELAVLYCFAFLLIAFAGPGALAIDGRRGQD